MRPFGEAFRDGLATALRHRGCPEVRMEEMVRDAEVAGELLFSEMPPKTEITEARFVAVVQEAATQAMERLVN